MPRFCLENVVFMRTPIPHLRVAPYPRCRLHDKRTRSFLSRTANRLPSDQTDKVIIFNFRLELNFSKYKRQRRTNAEMGSIDILKRTLGM